MHGGFPDPMMTRVFIVSNGFECSTVQIFLHSLVELEGVSPEEIASRFRDVMSRLKSQLATRLLKLHVDEIEVKIKITSITTAVPSIMMCQSGLTLF